MSVPVTVYPAENGGAELLLGAPLAEKLGFSAAEKLGVSAAGKLSVRFGCLGAEVFARVDARLPGDSLYLPPLLRNALRLPDFIALEAEMAHGALLLGPCVGLLKSHRTKRLYLWRLERMLVYAHDYDALRGAIIIFALDGIDWAKKQTVGFCYNPRAGRYEKGVYPLPSAVFRTVGLSREWKGRFQETIGRRLFNSDYFGKWKTYSVLSKDPAVSPHLPETFRYDSPGKTLDAARRCGAVFLKPSAGLGGLGIARLTAGPHGTFLLDMRENGLTSRKEFAFAADAEAAVQAVCKNGRYLVQQAVELPTLRGGVFDFRCIMQKDQALEWECRAIVGRRGLRGNIVSNIKSGGSAFHFSALRPKKLGLPFASPGEMEDAVRRLALDVCRALDEAGLHCGSLGVDIGVDTAGRPWLFEVNNRDPDPSIALDIREKELYLAIKTGPLFYAKGLSGFRPAPSLDKTLRES